MKTTAAANEFKSTVEQVIDATFAALDQSGNLYAVAKPVVVIGNQWGQLTVEVQLHWQIRGAIERAFEAAGLAPKMSNFGLASWV